MWNGYYHLGMSFAKNSCLETMGSPFDLKFPVQTKALMHLMKKNSLHEKLTS
jgi:hypothetical protein